MPKGFTAKNTKLKCDNCGKEFTPKTYNQRFCSEKCKYTYENERRKPYRNQYTKDHADVINLKAKVLVTWYKFQIFKLLGFKCVKCKEKDWRVLQIDHINHGGTQARILRGYKMGNRLYREILNQITGGNKSYQLLCANCNWRKRYEYPEEELGVQSNVPPMVQIWKALEQGRDGIVWKGKKFKFKKKT